MTVDRPGGVDLDALAEANRAVSRALDELDPFPGRYTLEVSSPGLERRLRTPAHFARAVGETVTVRTLPGTAAVRRVRGVLAAADDDGVRPRGTRGARRVDADRLRRRSSGRGRCSSGARRRAPDRAAKVERGAQQQERERSRS